MIRVGLFSTIYAILTNVNLTPGLKEDMKVSLSRGHHTCRSMPYDISVIRQEWTNYDVQKEWIVILEPSEKHYIITVTH